MPARVPRPWFREGRNMYYATIGPDQHSLGVTGRENLAEAEAALLALLARLRGEPPPPPGEGRPAPIRAADGPTVAEAANGFLRWCDAKVEAGKLGRRSRKNYREQIAHFSGAFGRLPVAAVVPEDVERWADVAAWSAADADRWPRHRPWSPSYQHDVLGTVGMMFKRAGRSIRFDRPGKESRGADVVLTDEQFALALATLRRKKPGGDGDIADLCELLRETGARPDEVAPLTVEAVDWPNRCVILKKHKTKRKTKKDRVIHFNTAAMIVLERMRSKHPTGLLFRNRNGSRYVPNMIVERLISVSKMVGFRVIAYGLGRHSFATAALVNGVPDTIVAGLLGHVDTKMVHTNYSHVGEQAGAMKAAAEKASGKRAG